MIVLVGMVWWVYCDSFGGDGLRAVLENEIVVFDTLAHLRVVSHFLSIRRVIAPHYHI